MKELTKAEELVLLTIWRMRDDVYGVTIKKRIKERTGKDIPYGTLYFLLDQLALKEYVFKIAGKPTPERGGRSKTFYEITPEGREALKAACEMYQTIWGNLTQLSFEGSS
jgi:DNA-binding PadR family transcriptional regulator